MAINTSQGGTGTVVTEYDQWRLTTTTSFQNQVLIYNLERQDWQGTYIGTGMSTNSGNWTFPKTGVWHIESQAAAYINSNIAYFGMKIQATADNGSNWQDIAASWNGSNYNITNPHFTQTCRASLDVTNTTNVKVRFLFDNATSVSVFGGTNTNYTCVTFWRLGDT